MDAHGFSPGQIGLSPSFSLTSFSDLKGCGCKVPQARLQEYLRDIGDGSIGSESPDCSIVPSVNGTFLLSTTDFFYPLVSDPYLQGRIACCNVLSDLYALGVDHVDTMLMTLAVSLKMSEEERRIVTRELIKGFNAAAQAADTQVTGGQTVMNPWPIIGGIAMTVATEDQFIRPTAAEVGDVIVLTKPLGTQLAVNMFEWLHDKPQVFARLNGLVSQEDVHRIYEEACVHMSALNRNAAKLMRKYHAKGATDVTGFGILGHAMNLASVQTRNVTFRINRIPVIRGVMAADKVVYNFRLKEGYSAETSGGLMVILSRDQAPGFIEEFAALERHPCWLIGEVLAGEKIAYIDPTADYLEV